LTSETSYDGEATSGERWTIPLGLSAAKVVPIGRWPVSWSRSVLQRRATGVRKPVDGASERYPGLAGMTASDRPAKRRSVGIVSGRLSGWTY